MLSPAEALAAAGMALALLGRVGLARRRTWGWAAGVASGVCWVAWCALLTRTPGAGGWVALANDLTMTAACAYGWWAWRRNPA